jgi:hypothetical protein
MWHTGRIVMEGHEIGNLIASSKVEGPWCTTRPVRASVKLMMPGQFSMEIPGQFSAEIDKRA